MPQIVAHTQLQQRAVLHETSYYELQLKNGSIVQTNTRHAIFSPIEYSFFKYGDGKVTVAYAQQLASLLIQQNKLDRSNKYFISGSAYQNAPTAATSLARIFYNMLKEKGYRVEYFKISGQSFQQDYASLDAIERKSMLAHIHLSVDDPMASKLADGSLIIVDDIKVTGLHQQALTACFERLGAKNINYAYIASVDPYLSACFPQIEQFLNHYAVRSLKTLSNIAAQPSFRPNARICKFVLQAHRTELHSFLMLAPLPTLKLLLKMMRDDSYDTMVPFVKNFHILEDFVSRN